MTDALQAAPSLPRVEWNADIDTEALAREFTETGRVQIKRALPNETALWLHKVFATQVPWDFTYSDGERTRYVPLEKFRTLSPAERVSIMQQVYKVSSEGFGFCYNTCAFHHKIRDGEFLDHPLKAFDDFMASPEFVDVMRKITGDDEIDGAGGAATWFGPGHYLNIHSDMVPDTELRAAFIYNLTPKWKADWGGELKFFPDKMGSKVEEAFFPSFNTFNILKLPKFHSVGVVAPFAAAPRFVISGWLYKGTPPLQNEKRTRETG